MTSPPTYRHTQSGAMTAIAAGAGARRRIRHSNCHSVAPSDAPVRLVGRRWLARYRGPFGVDLLANAHRNPRSGALVAVRVGVPAVFTATFRGRVGADRQEPLVLRPRDPLHTTGLVVQRVGQVGGRNHQIERRAFPAWDERTRRASRGHHEQPRRSHDGMVRRVTSQATTT